MSPALAALASFLTLAWMPSGGEWLVIAVFGLLLYNKRLPQVVHTFRKGFFELDRVLGFSHPPGAEDDLSGVATRASICLGVLGGVYVLAAVEEICRRGMTTQAVLLLTAAVVAGGLAWGIHRL